MQINNTKIVQGAVFLVALLLTACGSGGGSSAPPAVPKAWGTAALIESDNAGNALTPQITFGASGNALAVWYQSDGTRYNIWANRFE